MISTLPDNFSFPKRENSVQLSLIVREIFSRSRVQSDVFLFFRYIAISIDFNPSCTISYRVFYNLYFLRFFLKHD